jgi:CheY-like chemotaxis protein
MVNLILNAVHAMPEGGYLHLSAVKEGNHVRVDLRDTGTGMSPEVAERIFEPLFSTKGEQGTGMGLAVAAGIIREHDGEIRVASEPGSGSTFTVLLPVPEEVSSTVQSLPAVSDETTVEELQRRILVVDDEAMVRNVVTRLLELRGHTVWAASSGAEGMDVLEHHTVDMVITDQGMPRMSGRELAHHISARFPGLPVVLLTGDTDLSVDTTEIARVLTKPFRIEDLSKAIADLVPHTTS